MSQFKLIYNEVSGEDTATDNYLKNVPALGNGLKFDRSLLFVPWWVGTEPPHDEAAAALLVRDLDLMKAYIDEKLQLNPDIEYGLINLELHVKNIRNGVFVDESESALEDIFYGLKNHYPQIKWTNYNHPNRDYWLMTGYPSTEAKYVYIEEQLKKFKTAMINGWFDWLAPKTYDYYNPIATLANGNGNNLDRSREFCKSGVKYMRMLQSYANYNLPIFNVLFHGYTVGGRISHSSIEPNSSQTGTPYPIYNDDTHGSGYNGMYLYSPIPSNYWIHKFAEPSFDAGYDGIAMWHWNSGFFQYCMSSASTTDNILFRARQRWMMMQPNDFGFTPYTAPMPTDSTAWSTGSSSTTIRNKMRDFYKLMMEKKMDDIRQVAYKDEIIFPDNNAMKTTDLVSDIELVDPTFAQPEFPPIGTFLPSMPGDSKSQPILDPIVGPYSGSDDV